MGKFGLCGCFTARERYSAARAPKVNAIFFNLVKNLFNRYVFANNFLLACLKLLSGQLHRAVQTSGYASKEAFDQMLMETDYVLFDLKLIDPEDHKRHTGKDNDPVLKNFDRLNRSGVEFVPRTPLIPGVTDTEENLTAIAKLLKSYDLHYIELLPYNPMAGSKYALAGKAFCPTYDPQKPCTPREELFAQYGVKVKVY